MKDQLNQTEIELVESFVKNEALSNAVYKVLLQGLYSHGTIKAGYKPTPLKNGAFGLVSVSSKNPIPDEILGEHIRGMWEGIQALENAFKDLKSIKSENKDVPSPFNEAV